MLAIDSTPGIWWQGQELNLSDIQGMNLMSRLCSIPAMSPNAPDWI